MAVTARAPEEDPETRRRREIEEARSDASRTEETRQDVAREGQEVARQFGRRAASSGSTQLGSLSNFNSGQFFNSAAFGSLGRFGLSQSVLR